MSTKAFDPSSIPRYSVLRAPLRFLGTATPDKPDKLVVVLFHEKGCAVCMKATSQTQLYLNNPEMMSGCVYYPAGEIRFFPSDTVIEPDNLFAVLHRELTDPKRVLGTLPPDFHAKIIVAVQGSIRLSDQRKRVILEKLESK